MRNNIAIIVSILAVGIVVLLGFIFSARPRVMYTSQNGTTWVTTLSSPGTRNGVTSCDQGSYLPLDTYPSTGIHGA